MKKRALVYMQDALGHTGIPGWYARSRALSGAIILMYHSVADRARAAWLDPANHITPQAFREHARFLAARRRVVSLSELVECLDADKPIPAGTVVLTFDDGYLDNLEVAFPILEEYRLPATLFLPTQYIDNAESQWIDRLYTAFRTRISNDLDIEMADKNAQYTLDAHDHCVRAYGEISAYLLRAGYAAREELLASVVRQLQPAGNMPRLAMDWNDVREVSRQFDGIEIGSHTETHLDVTAHSDDVVRGELSRSKQRIEAELGRAVHYFSFPYNRTSDAALRMLEPLGYEAAVAADVDVRIRSSTPRFALPRLAAPASLGRLAFITSGAYPELSRVLVGRA